MRHQKIMKYDLLLLNSLILTAFVMIVDHAFIHNHLTIIQPLSDQYFDSTDMKQIEKALDEEIKKEDKIIEKIKKKDKKNDKKKTKKSKKERENEEILMKQQIDLEQADIYNEQLYDNYPEEYNDQQENPYYEEDKYYKPQGRPNRLRNRSNEKHYQFSEPMIDQADSVMAYNF